MYPVFIWQWRTLWKKIQERILSPWPLWTYLIKIFLLICLFPFIWTRSLTNLWFHCEDVHNCNFFENHFKQFLWKTHFLTYWSYFHNLLNLVLHLLIIILNPGIHFQIKECSCYFLNKNNKVLELNSSCRS